MTRPDRWRPYRETFGFHSHLDPRACQPRGERGLVQSIVVAEPLPDLRPAVDALLAEALQPAGQMVARRGMDRTYASYFRPRTTPTRIPREDS